jgi:carbon storage regulator
LGDSIVITIVKISGDKVRVGIDAPTDVLVLRDELEAHGPTGKEVKPAEDGVVLRNSA